MATKHKFWSTPLAPVRYVTVWLVYLVMRLVVLLPFRIQLRLGKSMGAALAGVLHRRRAIVDRNLAICFPELSTAARDALAVEHFRALGASAIEMSMAWFGSIETMKRLVTIEGVEHLRQGLERGRGVILYSGHFTSLEFVFPLLRTFCPRICGMYKLQSNPIMNEIMTKGRRRNVDRLFAKESVRAMIQELNRNSVVWYAADQSYALKGGALIPFFGEPAMTNTAIGRIARITGATVLTFFPRRLPDDSRYLLTIGAPLEEFPSADEIHDTKRLVGELEKLIRQSPEQYWWVHQRFKNRPAPFEDVYAVGHRQA